MIDWSVTKRLPPSVRLGLLAIALGPLLYGLILAVYWLADHIPTRAYFRAGLLFLGALEFLYVTALVAAMAGTPLLGLLLARSRRTTSRRSIGRGLLTCVSLFFALIAAESATAIWQHRVHRSTAMPIGGFRKPAPRRAADVSAKPILPALELDRPIPEFTDPPGDRQIDLVMVGASSAEGVPLQKWLSVDRIVAWQLGQVIPERPIHVSSLAVSGETLEQQHARLTELKRRADIVIIYCGHNEFKTRYSPVNTPFYYVADEWPTTRQSLIGRLEGVSPLCGLIAETAEKCRISIPPASNGMRDLIDVPVYSPVEYATLLADFKRRLEAMVAYTERIGAIPVLIVPAGNDAGYGPNRSFLPPTTPRDVRAAFESEFLAATRLEDHDPAASILRYRELLESQPDFADTHYRLARLLEKAGSFDEAYTHFVAARDLDGYPMRCMTPFQDVYRQVAARHGCLLIDAQAYLRRVGSHGQLDDELFQDMMHPSLRGYIALSQAVLSALKTKAALGWPQNVPVTAIDPARCAAHFGLDAETWKRLCDWQKFFNELVLPLRHDQSQRQRKRTDGATAAERLRQGIAPTALGLPNVGIPDAVPMVPYGTGEANDQAKAPTL